MQCGGYLESLPPFDLTASLLLICLEGWLPKIHGFQLPLLTRRRSEQLLLSNRGGGGGTQESECRSRAVRIFGEPPVSTAAVLQEALANLTAAIRDSGASINLGRLPATVAVKDVHLLQLFQNLIGNAIKYRAEAPPVINIAAEYEGYVEGMRT